MRQQKKKKHWFESITSHKVVKAGAIIKSQNWLVLEVKHVNLSAAKL